MTETQPSLTSDQKLWILLCHLSLFLGVALLAPFVVWLIKKKDDPVTEAHAREALNFHISIVIYCLVLFITMVGVFLIPFVVVIAGVFAIIASVKAVNGEFYRYPLTIRLVK